MCETAADKNKAEEKPEMTWEDLMDWDSYNKNHRMISTRMGVDKKDYMHCSTKSVKEMPSCNCSTKQAKQKPCCCCASCPVMDRAAAYEPKCPGPGKKGKANKAYMNSFDVNMVVQRLDMPGWEFDCPDRLQVKAKICVGCKIILDESRINVNLLPPELLKTFKKEPECLARQLYEGIAISIVYKGKEIARGCYEVPKAVIHRITNVEQEGVVHDGAVELTCRECTVGLVRVRFYMLMRCQEVQEVAVERLAGGQEREWCATERKPWLDRNVDPQDLTYMSEGNFSSSTSDPCIGFMPSDMIESSEFSSCKSANGDEGGCENLPPQLIDMAGPYPVYSCPNANDGCQDVTIEPPAGPSTQFTTEQRHVLGDGTTNRLCQKLSSPKLRQMHISGTRSCILCGEDVSWLPKVAACPHCGYKPVPMFKERDYDENATAHQILMDHLDNPVQELSFDLGSVEGCPFEGDDNNGEPGSASEAFETVVRDYQALKRSIRVSKTKAVQSKQTKISISGEQQKEANRPQELVKVFAELRDLFKEKETSEEQKIKDICAEASELAKGKKGKRKSGADACEAKNAGEVPQKKKQKKKRRAAKRSCKSGYYSMYTPQNRIKIRQNSVPVDTKVPAHMGWLWTAHPLASKPGWRPGAIRRSIRDVMSYFLKDFPVDSIPVSKYMSYYNQKKPPSTTKVEKCEDLVQVPTLHIEKKNDVYTITLRPLKDASVLGRSANPYVDMKPVQFRIVKNPLLKEVRDMKRCLKSMGFSKCTCHKPVMHCYCRSYIDKKRLVYKLREECDRRHIDRCEEDLILSDTSDSESEFDFGVTPPAGLMRPERLKSTHIKHTETQYDETDWAMPSMFPHPPHPEVQYASCVMGERKAPFNWVYGKGIIQEKPKAPKMRNIPKNVKKKKKLGRVAGGKEYQDSSVYSRVNNNYPPIRLRTPENYSTDSELPLSGEHMRRLDQAAYPPTAPQRQEPWAQEMEKERKRIRVKRRTKRLVRFEPTVGPRSSDSYIP